MEETLVSLCIPTNGATQWVVPCLESIYSQKADIKLYEVVVTDNGENSTLGAELEKHNYPNLTYYKTEDKGFLNLITSLKKGKGVWRKMINHRAVLVDGSINYMIECVEKYKATKPILYLSDGQVKGKDFIDCSDLDSFVYNAGIYTSWSAGVSVWNVDAEQLDHIEYNEMFPNMSMVFEMRQESKYIICNRKFFNEQDATGKGGYDLYNTFLVLFLDILYDLKSRGRISQKTFEKARREDFIFLCTWYYRLFFLGEKDKYTFILNDLKDSLKKYYSCYHYYYIMVYSYVIAPVRKLVGRLYRLFIH